jgi:Tfp pilus assembly protein PilE
MYKFKKIKPEGLSLLVIVIIVALVAVIIILISISIKTKHARQTDIAKENQLSLAAKAQEFYFDRYHRYADWEELVQAKLLTKIPEDVITLKPYSIYRTANGDEWCTWIQLESNKNLYLTQSDSGSKTITSQPTNLASCKSS